jgi:alpha-tubulin suppressor-like RCC1 family protein
MRALVLVLIASACVEPPKLVLGEQCTLNSECDAPLVCSLTRCRKECATLRDCPVGQVCVLDDREIGVCLLPAETTCALSSACPSPLVCRGGRCGNECNADRDCVPGAECLPETAGSPIGVCVDPSGSSCTHPSDCAAPLVCREGRCLDQCRADRDCREGSRCEGARCVVVRQDGGVPDAAVDAGDPPVVTCTDPSDCRAPFATAFDCVAGACVITACAGTRNDCDTDVATGCESDAEIDPTNCGACGESCGAEGVCAARTCDGYDSITFGNAFCVVRSSGLLVCSGSNGSGELGRGSAGGSDPVPRAVPGLPPIAWAVAGPQNVCAVARDGSLYCWGDGDAGTVGEGRWTTRHSPRMVTGFGDLEQIAIGISHVCARTTTELYCWGANSNGQLGLGDSTSRNVPTATGITDASWIAAGGDTTCAVRAGSVWCWGDNEHGELGDAMTHSRTCVEDCALSPVMVPGLTGATRVSVSQFHTCAIHGGGSVSCWGFGAYGACATDPAGDRIIATPRLVAGITDAREVAVSEEHTCVLREGGAVSCWGTNDSGALGHGMPLVIRSHVPVDVLDLADATSIDLNQSASCAMTARGHPVCWGRNTSGTLGEPRGLWASPITLESYPP